ncbi:MAG TPA: hypothetical protein EYH31_10895 [Anaerolineae bacterium]|nr:hypothetical protein [Anaerolineae bacterium]
MANSFDRRFTERARKGLTLAQEEAGRMNHNYIGTEHLLVGLVREGNGVAARALRDFGVELSRVRERVKGRRGQDQQTLLERQTGLTPRTKRVIELAAEEARRMGHPSIGTGHLLLGLIQEGEGLAIEVLRDLGVDLDALRTRIPQMIPEEPEGRPALRCTTCDRPLQADWRFCPFCGAPAPGRCPHCYELLPDEEGIRFCPHCGGQV